VRGYNLGTRVAIAQQASASSREQIWPLDTLQCDKSPPGLRHNQNADIRSAAHCTQSSEERGRDDTLCESNQTPY